MSRSAKALLSANKNKQLAIVTFWMCALMKPRTNHVGKTQRLIVLSLSYALNRVQADVATLFA